MRDHGTPPPNPGATPTSREEEIRALLQRLLRLVAGEVADTLRRRDGPATSRDDRTDDSERRGGC